MNKAKSFKSAICIIPPQSIWESIQNIRKDHDRAFERWMPHINLIFPFADDIEFQTLKPKAIESLKEIQPFELTFNTINKFVQGKSSTLWLQPDEKEDQNNLQLIEQQLVKTFPHCNDLSDRGFVPHLTIAQCSPSQTEKIQNQIQENWKSIQFTVNCVYFISRTDSDPFEIREIIPLGGVSSSTLVSEFQEIPIPTRVSPKTNPSMTNPSTTNPSITTNSPSTGVSQVPEGNAKMIRLEEGITLVEIPKNSLEPYHDEEVLMILYDISGSMDTINPSLAPILNKIMQNHCEKGGQSVGIIFGSSARLHDGNFYINNYEYKDISRGTNIISGVQVLHNELCKLPKGSKITVLFVSDGQDDPATVTKKLKIFSRPETLDINFLCVGVGRGYPANVALKFRDCYHSGRIDIPAHVLINDNGDCQEIMDIVAGYIGASPLVTINPSFRMFPSGKKIQETHVKSWILLEDFSSNEIQVNENLIPLCGITIQYPDVCSILMQWINSLHILDRSGISRDIVKEKAAETKKMSNLLFSQMEKEPQPEKLNLTQRLLVKAKKTQELAIQMYLKEIQRLVDGEFLEGLSDLQLAQRMDIGAVATNKYAEKGKMKLMTETQYKKIIDSGCNAIQELLQLDLPEIEEDRSIVTLETLKDVITSENIIEAIRQADLYTLLDSFVINGIPLQVSRPDGIVMNPYMVKVKSASALLGNVDAHSMQKFKESGISIGSDDVFAVNCILPLFSKEKYCVYAPFIRSLLFKFVSGYQGSLMPEHFDPTLYFGLLSSYFLFLLNEKESEYRTEQMKLVCDSVFLAYNTAPWLQEYKELLKSPIGLNTIDTPSLNKAILAAHYFKEEIKISENFIESLIIEFIGRANTLSILEWFNTDCTLEETYSYKKMEKTYLRDTYIKEALKNITDPIVKNVKFSFLPEKLEKLSHHAGITLSHIRSFAKLHEVSFPENLQTHVVHGISYGNSRERMEQLCNGLEENIENISKIVMGNAIVSWRKKTEEHVRQLAYDDYTDWFVSTHSVPFPLEQNKVEELCRQKKIPFSLSSDDFFGVGYVVASGLCASVCLCEDCPFGLYKEPVLMKGQLANHIQTCPYPVIPAAHKTYKALPNASLDEIMEALKSGKYLKFATSEMLATHREKVIANEEIYRKLTEEFILAKNQRNRTQQ